MKTSISKRVAAGVLALGLTGGVAVGTGTAFATTTKSATGTISSVTAKSDSLVVKVGTKSDTFKTTSMTTIDLGGKKSTLSKLKAGDSVKVTYTTSGKTLTATSVDATA